jgi:hypothetical protein
MQHGLPAGCLLERSIELPQEMPNEEFAPRPGVEVAARRR